MVFKKMLSAFGVGGPSIDTQVANPQNMPGGTVTGTIHLQGGEVQSAIENISLALVTRVEVESGDHEYLSNIEFGRLVVYGPFQLMPKAQHSMPFSFRVPVECPLTTVYGQHLRGMTMGLRTELAIAGAIDKGDLDPLAISPMPAQQMVLDAFANLGFRFKRADCERGRIRGVDQTLPFYQEIEFYPSSRYAGSFNEVELTFVAEPHELNVVLEADKRRGSDVYAKFTYDYRTIGSMDLAGQLDNWFQSKGRRGFF
ncbi:MAG: sporulation protein [Polyangiaceae bacterium]|nr:sporulation protein [Polyangiaceae bacterium]